MTSNKPPLLSIIIPSRSLADNDLQRLLTTLTCQTFRDYEILVETRGNSEEAKAYALQRAQGQLVAFFCTDNDLREPTFLKTMVWYANQPGVTGAYPVYYDYVNTDTALNRYFALLGANDPLCWWLGKADRLDYRYPIHQSQLREIHEPWPSLGDNGCFFQRVCLKDIPIDPATFGSCMCLTKRLQAQGHTRYWQVTEQKLWHRTGTSLWRYLTHRYYYVKTLYVEKRAMRQWHMVSTPQDYVRVALFIMASVCWVPHLWLALAGYRRLKDPAWFLHPLLCSLVTLVYSLVWLVVSSQWLFRVLIGRRS